jgi:hypothetical protein
MVVGKMAALTEAQVATAATIVTGRSHTAAKKVVQVFKKRMRANRKKAFTPTPTTVNGGSSWEQKAGPYLAGASEFG